MDFLDYVPLDTDHLNVYSLKLITIILEKGPETVNSSDLVSFPNPGFSLIEDQDIIQDRKAVGALFWLVHYYSKSWQILNLNLDRAIKISRRERS